MPDLADLRRRLAVLATATPGAGLVGFGMPDLDDALGGGLARAGLHEVLAATPADLPAAAAVALGLATRAAGAQRMMLWARQDPSPGRAGGVRPHPPGLAELGFDPARLLLVRAADATAVLRAGAEAARCAALGAVLIEPVGTPRQFDLTASRRLSLAAQAAGVFTLVLRAGGTAPSAAHSRWQVQSLPSRALAANAPGAPAFALRLLRHRGGLGEQQWHVEWDRETSSFRDTSDPAAPRRRAAVPGTVVALPADRPAAAAGAAAA